MIRYRVKLDGSVEVKVGVFTGHFSDRACASRWGHEMLRVSRLLSKRNNAVRKAA